jgi:Fe-Mn family superoxide dismutase
MNSQKLNYLNTLLQWVVTVENIIEQIYKGKEEFKEWKETITDLKGQITEQLESKKDISDTKIGELQEKAKNLMNDLEGKKRKEKTETTPPGSHELPPLPYSYEALEPYISERIMKLHHKEHHQSYVEGLNKAEKKLYDAKMKEDTGLIKHWMREQAFHGSGHYLHTIFWFNMSPNGGGKPKGTLMDQIVADFGSFQQFKKLFTKAAESVEGVGWAILVWEPRGRRLGIQTVEKHQLFSLWDTIPLLVLDVWEHAYYLQYENNRKKYIENWWNIVNWDDVSERWDQAKQLKWQKF